MVGRQHIGEDNLADLALPLGSNEVFSIAPVIVGGKRVRTNRVRRWPYWSVVHHSLALACLEALRLRFWPIISRDNWNLDNCWHSLVSYWRWSGPWRCGPTISPTPKPQQLSEAERLQSFSSAGLSTRLRKEHRSLSFSAVPTLAVWSFQAV